MLLMISLVGCIVPRHPRLLARPARPAAGAPRNLTRLPGPRVVRDRRSRPTTSSSGRGRCCAAAATGCGRASDGDDAVSAERGYLREAGNLVFHLSVLVVLVGFAVGGLFGYKGGVILVEGSTFSNNLTQYDDFDPGSLFRAEQMEPFSFTVDNFDVEWLTAGPRRAWPAASTPG